MSLQMTNSRGFNATHPWLRYGVFWTIAHTISLPPLLSSSMPARAVRIRLSAFPLVLAVAEIEEIISAPNFRVGQMGSDLVRRVSATARLNPIDENEI